LVTFTYSVKEVRRPIKLFHDTQIKIAFHTQNTIQNTLKPPTKTDNYNRSNIYQIKSQSCPLKFTGQTGRIFDIRYKEHIHFIKHNKSNSGYSNHTLNTGHIYGTIIDTMGIIKTGKEGKHLNTLQKCQIYKTSKDNLHMIDTHTDTTPYSRPYTNFTPDSSTHHSPFLNKHN
jgi:hypothetical protein